MRSPTNSWIPRDPDYVAVVWHHVAASGLTMARWYPTKSTGTVAPAGGLPRRSPVRSITRQCAPRLSRSGYLRCRVHLMVCQINGHFFWTSMLSVLRLGAPAASWKRGRRIHGTAGPAPPGRAQARSEFEAAAERAAETSSPRLVCADAEAR